MTAIEPMRAEKEKHRHLEPEIFIYSSTQGRVMTFGGLLGGLAAAYEGEPGWYRGFILAELLGVKPKPLYGYQGSLDH